MPVRFQFVPGEAPDLLDLPWSTPLEAWETQRLITMTRGMSRHVVRFVRGSDDDERVFALKETTEELARREYNLLRFMRDESLAVVEAVGIVTGRQTPGIADRQPLPAVLVTRYLDYSLPYGYVFSIAGGGAQPGTEARLVDAAVILLCRLHLEGFYWGDCSLNNLLFRRDAGALMAYLVDAETAEHRRTLSNGMRQADVDLACEHVVGGLMDLAAAERLPEGIDPIEVSERLLERYETLWSELTTTEHVSADDRHAIERRIRHLHGLGFDVGELLVEHDPEETTLQIRPALVEEGHHARELQRLTGLEVQENQARHLLNDIAAFGAWLESGQTSGKTGTPSHDDIAMYGAYLEGKAGRTLPLAVVAARWIAEVYEPLLAAVPPDLSAKFEPPQLFHELLEHRYALADTAGHTVTNEEALASLVAEVLRRRPDERILTDDG